MRTPRKVPSPCKIPYCVKRVRAGKALMCSEHWAKVPQAERDAIYTTLRDWNGSGDPRAYLDAVRKAIDSVIVLEGNESARRRARERQGELGL